MWMYRLRSPSYRKPSFSTTRRLAWFSGRMQISMRCRRSSLKHTSVASATAVGVIPRPANRSDTQ